MVEQSPIYLKKCVTEFLLDRKTNVKVQLASMNSCRSPYV